MMVWVTWLLSCKKELFCDKFTVFFDREDGAFFMKMVNVCLFDTAGGNS